MSVRDDNTPYGQESALTAPSNHLDGSPREVYVDLQHLANDQHASATIEWRTIPAAREPAPRLRKDERIHAISVAAECPVDRQLRFRLDVAEK